jgi:hypothetical protein
MRITTTTSLYALLHLKVVIARLKAIEQQGTLTTRGREVVREQLGHAYDWADAMPRMGGGTQHAAH